MDKKNQHLIILLVLAAVVLVVGAWLLFKYLPKKTVTTTSNDLEAAVKIENIKRLAEQDLKFFPLDGDDVLEQLEKTGQYQGLTLNIDTTIDLYNPGNAFPFGTADSAPVVEQ